MKYYMIIATLFIGFLISCDKDEPGNNATLPTNLVSIITVDEGTVTVQATADNANFFTIIFEESGETNLVESNDGSATYTYSQSGNYSIEVRANTTHEEYINEYKTVNINIGSGGSGGIPTTGYTTPTTYAGYTLVWSDEFDGTTLSGDWVYEIGNGQAQGIPGWGNNELQYYRQENVEVTDGYAIITAKQELYNGYNYTSARIKTQGMQSFEKGRIDIRAALPYSKGIWPALWMLGDNITSVGWPQCGEIDIMELTGGDGNDDRVLGTAHWDEAGTYASFGGSNTLSSGIFADEFHVFSIVWDNNEIKWYRDDIPYHTLNISGAELSEFHQNFFFIFNIAVGGTLPGNPDASTVFPQQMAIDYVRVFQ